MRIEVLGVLVVRFLRITCWAIRHAPSGAYKCCPQSYIFLLSPPLILVGPGWPTFYLVATSLIICEHNPPSLDVLRTSLFTYSSLCLIHTQVCISHLTVVLLGLEPPRRHADPPRTTDRCVCRNIMAFFGCYDVLLQHCCIVACALHLTRGSFAYTPLTVSIILIGNPKSRARGGARGHTAILVAQDGSREEQWTAGVEVAGDFHVCDSVISQSCRLLR